MSSVYTTNFIKTNEEISSDNSRKRVGMTLHSQTPSPQCHAHRESDSAVCITQLSKTPRVHASYTESDSPVCITQVS